MDKRYQVFVSSTYKDLLEARQEVMQALLELDCIPAGMELFPAADDDQWTLIKQVIDDCDYYLVIIAGRYGSTGPGEKSFTQLEYEHAISQEKPVLAFLHKDPGKLPADDTEQDPQLAKKLDDFRNLARKKMVRHWTTPADLGSAVSRSIIKLIKSNPAVGWVKADLLPSQEASKEILDLRSQVDELQREIKTINATAQKETVHLAQGEDEFEIKYTFHADQVISGHSFAFDTYSASFSASWSQIFARISPLMIDEASEWDLQHEMDQMTEEVNIESLQENPNLKEFPLNVFRINPNSFNTIKVQLLALKLITKSIRDRSRKDRSNYWTLTPYGETLMMELRAIRRGDYDEPAPRPSIEATKANAS